MFHKIPQEIRLSVCNKVSKENWNLEAVLKELKKELANREHCDYSSVSHSGDSSAKEDQKPPPVKKSGCKRPLTTSTLMAGSEGNLKPSCVYCGQHHPSIQCTIVTNIQKCKEILRNSGRCFICIRKNHLSRNCCSRSRCSKCQGRHHSTGWRRPILESCHSWSHPGESGPTAIHTKLGWVLSGPVHYQVPSSNTTINLTSTHVLKCQVTNHPDPDLLDSKLERFWRLESLGIVPNESSVYDHFQERIHYDGKRYEVNLPWKEPHPMLPDNYNLSKSRLMSLLSRLRRDPEVLKEYHAVIQEQLNTGIVERVEEGGAGEVHYLAHHPVIHQDKQTTKVRVVYDASAKQSGGPSLNDCLYSGPPLSETIADVLLRFRCHKTALIGDIEKAFLMISVAEDDRDALRFLWFDDPFSEDPALV